MADDTKHSMWVNIARYFVSAVVGAVFAAFVLGRNAQKINDVLAWKQTTAPLIEHMNRSGTVSFEHFFVQYEKTQVGQERRLEDLEKRLRELEKKADP